MINIYAYISVYAYITTINIYMYMDIKVICSLAY